MDIDKIQNAYDIVNEWADEGATRLANSIDAYFLYEVVNAANTIDDASLGGTSGNGITVTTGNIAPLFGKVAETLAKNNVPMGEGYIVVSPQIWNVLWQYVQGKQSLLGDKTSEFGNLGRYAGLEIYVSNNLTGSAVWVPSAGLTAGDTITITEAGGTAITFTFQTTIGSTAGNVLESSTATGMTNLAALINAGGASSDSGVSNVSLSTANQRRVQNWAATATATQITVFIKGGSYLTVTSSVGGNVWTAAKQLQLLMAGRKGKSVDLVIQKMPNVEMASTVSAGKIGTNIIPYTLFGVKTFNQGTFELVQIKVRSDAY